MKVLGIVGLIATAFLVAGSSFAQTSYPMVMFADSIRSVLEYRREEASANASQVVEQTVVEVPCNDASYCVTSKRTVATVPATQVRIPSGRIR